MTTYFLASEEGAVVRPPPRPRPPRLPLSVLTLESMDGLTRIPLDGSSGWIRMPGATGLRLPPYQVIAAAIPGVPGSILQEVRVEERPVFLPLYCGGFTDQRSFQQMIDQIAALIDPTTGTFRIIGTTAWDERELIVSYVSGLEGADGADTEGLSWAKLGLVMAAHQPYARAREGQGLEFVVATAGEPFLGVAGGTDAAWPTALSGGQVIGSGMEVYVDSEVPVYPILELVGPMDSFSSTMSPVVVGPDGSITTLDEQQWAVDIPLGVPAGSTYRVDTDPRVLSFRMNGGLASGRVARGSTLRAFYPGLNILNVTAPGGTSATRIRLSWLPLYRSLW